MLEVQHLGDELERSSPILGPVRPARVLEQLERLLERREHDHRLGLRFRFRLGLVAPPWDRDEREGDPGRGEEEGEGGERGEEESRRDSIGRGREGREIRMPWVLGR